MEEHRARHREKYLERERLIRIKENYIESLANHTTLDQVKNTTTEILEFVEKAGSDFGLKVLDAINNNQAIKTDFNNRMQIRMSQQVQENVKKILELCGIEGVEVNYEMDCSQDEEIARQLAQEVEPEPPRVRRPRGRPRRVVAAP